MTTLDDRVRRLERRRGLDRPTHRTHWWIEASETPEQALHRAAAAGVVSCGLLLPRGYEQALGGIEQWECDERDRRTRKPTTVDLPSQTSEG